MSRADRSPLRRIRGYGAALLIAVTAGCVGNPAPGGWLPAPRAAPEDAYGAWIGLRLSGDQEVIGEFLALEHDSVFVLSDDGAVRAVPTDSVTWARIAWFDSQWATTTAGWGVLGTLSTFSHGIGLLLTMPAWIIAGTVAAASDSRAPMVHPLRTGWDGARMYARYPAGLPPQLPRTLPLRRSAR